MKAIKESKSNFIELFNDIFKAIKILFIEIFIEIKKFNKKNTKE